jgi:hypothetical protein
MVKGLILNPFAAAYILGKTRDFECFAFEMTSNQREEEFGQVIGEDVIVSCTCVESMLADDQKRCNNLLESRLAGLSASKSSAILQSR